MMWDTLKAAVGSTLVGYVKGIADLVVHLKLITTKFILMGMQSVTKFITTMKIVLRLSRLHISKVATGR